MASSKSLFAFAHIEHTAGTTLNHILRRNFFLKFLDVSPMSRESRGVFQCDDLRKAFTINPRLLAISGHSVKVYSDLASCVPGVQYVTVLRDPVKRYVSHYFHRMFFTKSEISFEEFLKDEVWSNFQTKSIVSSNFFRNGAARREELDLALEFIDEKYFVVGFVEDFDEFLVLLRKKLQPIHFEVVYERKNVTAKNNRKRGEVYSELIGRYRDEIMERNVFDLELTHRVREGRYARQRAEVGEGLSKAVAELQSLLKTQRPGMFRSYVDFLVRKTYYEPAVGGFRMMGGLPYRGRY